VTGASGFVGRHLVAALAERGYSVLASGRRGPPAGLPVTGWLSGDLLEPSFADELVRISRPTHVFHLAGLLGQGAPQRRLLLETHVLATAALLESLAGREPAAWLSLASSSAVYGNSEDQPLGEATPVRPITDYATSKVAEETVAAQFRLAAGVRCCVLRLFNLVGPGQSDTLLLSGIARQVAEQEHSADPVVRVGNCEPRRDYLDVRDAVRAMVDLADLCCTEPVVNIGSGRSRSVRECIDLLLGAAMKSVRIEVDPGLVRPRDIPEQCADVSLLRGLTSWSPTIDFEDSLADLLDYWRARVAQPASA